MPHPAPASPAQAKATPPTPAGAPVALGALSNALMKAPPSPALGKVGRTVCLLVVLGIAGVALYLAVRQFKGQKDGPEQPYVIDAAKLVPAAPLRRTGDPYWDHLLGYDR